MTRPRSDRSGRARSMSRRLALQALYQWQMTGQSFPELRNQYTSDEGYAEVDAEYFQQLLQGVIDDSVALDAMIGGWLDRPVAQLDPVEHAVLLLGVEELRAHVEVPYKVVLNECVELTKKFGATDGHKFINAVLDRAARQLRAAEQPATARRSPGK
ncbi:MAG: transcription antitermination factor NusB [Steroidobacteraceae bacterium]|nr:transcription antitermination factor NusB [Pseudomonadota bacterium]MBP7608397.1 transcription antitermination factor NusB [Steroidobacteraceae bacterium]